MRLRNLKWLTLLGPLGALSIYQPMFAVMFGFLAFLPLFGADERTEANLARAATNAYAVTLAVLVVAFGVAGLAIAQHWSTDRIVQALGMMLAITYIAHVLTFIAGYLYLEFSGR